MPSWLTEDRSVQRRSVIQLLFGSALSVLLGLRPRRAVAKDGYAFEHGVASGDPLADGIMLWTRVDGASGETVMVDWQITTDPKWRQLTTAGRLETGPAGCVRADLLRRKATRPAVFPETRPHRSVWR